MPTDLLDMFKQRPAKGSSPARATSRTRDTAPHGSSRGMGTGDTGGTRKLVLGGAVMILLLALAFTAGVGVGRARRPAADPALLAARSTPDTPTESWGIRGRSLPSLAAKGDSLRIRVLEELIRRWPELSNFTSVVDGKDKTGKPTGLFRIVLAGFRSKDDAQAVAADLAVWAVDGYLPFSDSRPERMTNAPLSGK